MGQTVSQLSGQSSPSAHGAPLFGAGSRRFRISEVAVYPYEDDSTLIAPSIEPNAPCPLLSAVVNGDEPNQTLKISRSDRLPIEYVLDPDSSSLVLKLPSSGPLTIKFQLSLVVTPGSGISGLTFVTEQSAAQVSRFLETELHQNPNVQNNKNVVLLGDFQAPKQSPHIQNLTFLWTWHPESRPMQKGGWPVRFCFCEYTKRLHRLTPLAGGEFWVPPGRVEPERPMSPLAINISSEHYASEIMSPESACGSPPREYKLKEQPESPVGSPETPGMTLSLMKQLLAQNDVTRDRFGKPARPETAAQRPNLHGTHHPEDGPVFRSTTASMEKRFVLLKQQSKSLLKRAIFVHQQFKDLLEAISFFQAALLSAVDSQTPSLAILLPFYGIKGSQKGIGALENFLSTASNDFAQHVIIPLRDLYEGEIKTYEIRKREFEDESSQYYSWMSRYLSTKKERRDKTAENDAKYVDKRRAFEMARFDYYAYLLDIHGGSKLQYIVLQFALFAQRLTQTGILFGSDLYSNTKPGLDTVVDDLREAGKSWSVYNSERESQRRALERSLLEEVHPNQAVLSPRQLDSVVEHPAMPQPGSPPCPKERNHHREGLLWALSKPGGVTETQNMNKQGMKWHKYWVVLDRGKLYEYTNWKQTLDLHNEVIDLKVANVREARSAERRFCFEVTTPNYRRVYQAPSADDMAMWIASISAGISSSLESYPKDDTLSAVKTRESKDRRESVGRRLSLKNERPRGGPALSSSPSSAASAPISIPRNHSLPHSSSGSSSSSNPLSLLSQVQKASSNRTCADCGTTTAVDWVSISLLVVICIECSGAHRALGSHITKVRSLVFDTVSFTPDLVSALLAVNNQALNEIWEAKLGSKPAPNDMNRGIFVTEKYMEKRYIHEIERPITALRKAVADQDTLAVCAALASRANPNAITDDGTPLIVYALRSALPDTQVFGIAELLILNGATVPAHLPQHINPRAVTFLLDRMRRAS